MAKRRRRKKKKGIADIIANLQEIDVDLWLDVMGYALLAVALLTLLSFASANHGVVPAWWLGVLSSLFGWGTYLTPLFVGAIGLWLVLRDFGDRLPTVTPLQMFGVLMGYLALLVTLHFSVAALRFEGNLAAPAEGGIGGGRLGALLTAILRQGLGGPGLVVALVTWWLVVVVLTFGITVKDAAAFLRGLPVGSGRARGRRRKPASPLPTPPKKEESEKGKSKPKPIPQPKPARPKPIQINAPTIQSAREPSPPAAPMPIQGPEEEPTWELPKLNDILEPGNGQDFSEQILRRQARTIEETLESLGAPVRVKEINRGPVITQFGIEPMVVTNGNGTESKVKVSRIRRLADDVALALEAKTLRVEAPIPGKGLVGLEVPNPEISLVALRDVMESEAFAEIDSHLRLCLGQGVSGEPVVADLTAMPHLLIAGTTGSGKSVCLNAIIATLLLQNSPTTLEFLMVDPKRVELTGYNGIPHLKRSKVVVDMERVTGVLQWVLREMDRRYRQLSKARSNNILDYNRRIAPKTGDKLMPYIVVVIDELADLMMLAPDETERSLCRIAQKARATGIHLLVATQRPSVDVVTGLIKANFPARIAFNVASATDSRVILDSAGAEQLLGEGDMLFLPPDAPAPTRLQGAFVSNEELRGLVQFWKEQSRPKAVSGDQQSLWKELEEEKESEIEYEDELLPEVIDVVLRENRASISLLQRKLHIGYTRGARIMDILERNDVVGPQPSGGKAREVHPRAARRLLHPDQEA